MSATALEVLDMSATQLLSIALSILLISVLPGSLTAQPHYYHTAPTSPGPQPVFKVFSFSRFEQNLKLRLAGKSMGYAYAIYERDVLKRAGSGGVAVWPHVPHSPDRRTTMLSMSKTITAAAVMKAMEQIRARGRLISINSPIAPYLPVNWHKGENVSRMTFKHLL